MPLRRAGEQRARDDDVADKVYDLGAVLADHARPVRYQMQPPPAHQADRPKAKKAELYIHAPRGRHARHIDDATETFVDETRGRGATP